MTGLDVVFHGLAQFEAVHAVAQHDVCDEDVDPPRSDRLQSLLCIGDALHAELSAERLDDHVAHVSGIVDDQHDGLALHFEIGRVFDLGFDLRRQPRFVEYLGIVAGDVDRVHFADPARTGSQKVKRVYSFSQDSTSIAPSCSSTSDFTYESPTPEE